eukprot:1768177-Prymnesium_polylepis.1
MARSTTSTIHCTHALTAFARCCCRAVSAVVGVMNPNAQSSSASESSSRRHLASRFLAASRVRAAAASFGNSAARTRFFCARSAALMDPSICRRNCRVYRVPPVDTLSMVTTMCWPVSSGAELSCTTCDGRCGVDGTCSRSASHCRFMTAPTRCQEWERSERPLMTDLGS